MHRIIDLHLVIVPFSCLSLALFYENISAVESPCALHDPAVPYLELIIGFMHRCAPHAETRARKHTSARVRNIGHGRVKIYSKYAQQSTYVASMTGRRRTSVRPMHEHALTASHSESARPARVSLCCVLCII